MNIFTLNVSEALNRHIEVGQYSRVFILCDTHSKNCCLPLLHTSFKYTLISVEPGEYHKNLQTCSQIWKQLAEADADRNAVLINLGGGGITDMGGFAAATYQRGIDFIHIPTTLLAMVDAGIGGKTGVNLGDLKNYVGVFKLPVACICSPVFLQSLPNEELLNGKAEMIKHGALAGGELWELCSSDFPPAEDHQSWLHAIQLNAEFKANITRTDFKENNIRAMLNFGHTAGHALESLALKSGKILPHGKAVAAGMIIETLCANMAGVCEENWLEILSETINRHFKPVNYLRSDIPNLIDYCRKDKKNENDDIIIVPVREAGNPLVKMPISSKILTGAFEQYCHDTAQMC